MNTYLSNSTTNFAYYIKQIFIIYIFHSMGALDEYIECKHGRQEVKYIHPDMKPILESTYGCMIYQEQLMLFLM